MYRYLGHNHGDNENPIIVRYNDIYVSWSKNKFNPYFRSKFNGTITLLTCNISDEYYGIDLKGIANNFGNEKEVVFPTIKDTIICEEYI